jgi:hypothetical protein
VWKLAEPKPVKLVAGILAADEAALKAAREELEKRFGKIDLESEVWPFESTEYYADETGPAILRQFVGFEKLVDPEILADVKHATNEIEQKLAAKPAGSPPRPANIDPGMIEPAKLVLASTKNYSHRIYIGGNIYAEVTLVYEKGSWQPMTYTYPDYRKGRYMEFFEKARRRLLEQLRSKR